MLVRILRIKKKHFKRLQKYQYGLDYLLNEHNEEDYITDARKNFNVIRSSLPRKEINGIRRKLSKKEAVCNFLKAREQEGSLTNKQKKALKNIERHLKNFKKDLEKLQKYNIKYSLDYLFNEVDEVGHYELKEVKSTFDGNYVLYESKGDKDNN